MALRNTNVILALALTHVRPILVLTTRVLDKADPRTVLYTNSVVDTPSADPTLTASQFLALTGIQLVDLATDAPGTPPTTAAVWLGVFQNTDGRQPVPRATFDNLELWTYRVPIARCVDANSAGPTPPYTNWATAARVIQDAVDAAAPGDEIVVTNGVYATGARAITGTLTNRVAIDKAIHVKSVNGPAATFIVGAEPTVEDAGIRCAYLGTNAVLSGFTLTNGATGVECESSAIVSNCVMTGNSHFGAIGGTLHYCTLTGNFGGAGGSTLYNCTVTGNVNYGGADGSTLHNCTLSRNGAKSGGGVYRCTLYNCTLTGNSAGWGGGALQSTLYNCTVTGNSAGQCGGAMQSTLYNCIVYYNTSSWAWASGPNYDDSTFAHSCTTPLPTNGVGNITSAPLFVDGAAGNLRLQSNSPCINAGNNAYAPGPTDLDGNPRIVSGTVDIGAYEFQGIGSMISYAWLQHYGLPTDGSADATDPDADGHNTWQEWRCQTCPTNALSVLRLLSATFDGTNVTVNWQSVAGVDYFLECSTNLTPTPRFTLVATNLPGQPGTTSFSDTNAAGAGPFFYRVGVGD